jgi:hypothetical protein
MPMLELRIIGVGQLMERSADNVRRNYARLFILADQPGGMSQR